MTSGHLKEEVRQDSISRALCLLENPLITSFQSNISPRLKFYFMYCTDYLARQGLINSNGDPVGFAGLASHLHYHEPYNIAFCHLLHRGVLHTVCKKTEQGLISSNGDPVGFAGLASHLHYHEPYNIAFCHLLHRGVLHTVCKKNKQ